MNFTRRAALLALSTSLICAGLSGAQAQAQDWPTKPIELASVGAAGGSTDTVWRVIADHVSKSLGQQVLVNYKPGGGGNIAGEYVARKPADGYSFMMTTMHSHGIAPNIFKDLNYDPVADLRGVAKLVDTANVLYVNDNIPVNSVQELIDYAKAHPGEVNYAIASIGNSGHMSGVLFSQMAEVELTAVPYKASAPAVQGMLAGEADISFENLSAVLPHIKAGTVKALAVTTPQRWPDLPDVPTMAEAGVAGFDVTSWFGIVAPRDTPDAIVTKFSEAIRDALADPELSARMLASGSMPAWIGPQDLDDLIRHEVARWKPVVESAGVTAQ